MGLLNVFREEKEKLIEYVMKENENNLTALDFATYSGHTKIVKLLFTTFSGEKDKLIRYVMKEDIYNVTPLHHASEKGHEEIVKLFLNVFSKEEKNKLIDYMMKESEDK